MRPLPLVAIGLLVCATSALGEDSDVLIVRVHATNGLGLPVPGALVTLAELERYNIGFRDIGRTNRSGWVVTRLSCSTGDMTPDGWGVYRIIVRKEGFGWSISDLLVHESGDPKEVPFPFETYSESIRHLERPSAWRIGSLVDLRNRRDVTIQMKLIRGATVRGVVHGPRGEPIAAASITVQMDLEAQSHTGAGGELPFGEVRSATDGRFEVTGLGDFLWWFNAGHPKYPYGTQTREDCGIPVQIRNGMDQALEITLRERGTRYYGRVLTPAGQPIPGATVTAGYDGCMNKYSWGFEDRVTDREGRFEFIYEYANVYMITAKAPGFLDSKGPIRPARAARDPDDRDGHYVSAGELDFVLQPVP